jgi:hypothetical protein
VSRRVEIIAPFRVLVRKVGVAPGVANGAVDDDGQQDVHHDAGHHYQEPLPGGFGPEFVGFDRLFHLFLVHRFVDHAGDLDVAAQRQPAQTVLRVAPLELEERKPRVEEDVEFFDADLESPGHQEVPEFVNAHEDREAEKKLSDFDKNIHCLSVRFSVCFLCQVRR